MRCRRAINRTFIPLGRWRRWLQLWSRSDGDGSNRLSECCCKNPIGRLSSKRVGFWSMGFRAEKWYCVWRVKPSRGSARCDRPTIELPITQRTPIIYASNNGTRFLAQHLTRRPSMTRSGLSYQETVQNWCRKMISPGLTTRSCKALAK